MICSIKIKQTRQRFILQVANGDLKTSALPCHDNNGWDKKFECLDIILPFELEGIFMRQNGYLCKI